VPIAVLSKPVVLFKRAIKPVAVLPPPSVLAERALLPIAVLLKRRSSGEACCHPTLCCWCLGNPADNPPVLAAKLVTNARTMETDGNVVFIVSVSQEMRGFVEKNSRGRAPRSRRRSAVRPSPIAPWKLNRTNADSAHSFRCFRLETPSSNAVEAYRGEAEGLELTRSLERLPRVLRQL
jgi:hypothetical protein